MKSYFDGSGNFEDRRSDYLTLVGFVTKAWPSFESRWEATLQEHGAPGYLHMREATKLADGFSVKNGWEENRVNDLIVSVIQSVRDLALKDLFAFSCTVDLQVHRKLLKTEPDLMKAPHICASHCFGKLLDHEREHNPGLALTFEVFFDRDEKFFPVIHRMWQRRWKKGRVRARVPNLFQCLASMASVNSRDVYPCQLADLLAWLINRKYTVGDRAEWLQQLTEAVEYQPHLVDADNIANYIGP
jgi:hypothetical protein